MKVELRHEGWRRRQRRWSDKRPLDGDTPVLCQCLFPRWYLSPLTTGTSQQHWDQRFQVKTWFLRLFHALASSQAANAVFSKHTFSTKINWMCCWDWEHSWVPSQGQSQRRFWCRTLWVEVRMMLKTCFLLFSLIAQILETSVNEMFKRSEL